MERLHSYVYGEPVRVQTNSQTTGDDSEEANCHGKPKTSKATLEACKIQDSVRVSQGKGQLNSRCIE